MHFQYHPNFEWWKYLFPIIRPLVLLCKHDSVARTTILAQWCLKALAMFLEWSWTLLETSFVISRYSEPDCFSLTSNSYQENDWSSNTAWASKIFQNKFQRLPSTHLKPHHAHLCLPSILSWGMTFSPKSILSRTGL